MTEFSYQKAKGNICMHIFKKENVMEENPVTNRLHAPKKEI